MKTSNRLILAALSLIAAMTAASCEKDPYKEVNEQQNPAVEKLPAAPFTVSATEVRCQDTGKTYEWTIAPDGRTDSVTEGIDDMYVTAANAVTITVKGHGSAYKGVNVRSTNASAVVVREGGKPDTWRLWYAGDGEADIEVWNGSGKSAQKTVFHVTSVKAVKPEAVVFLWYNKDRKWEEVRVTEFWHNRIDFVTNNRMSGVKCHILLPSTGSKDMDPNLNNRVAPLEYHELRFLRIEPENTSYRYVEWCSSTVSTYLSDWMSFVKEAGYECNWTEPFQGDFADLERNLFLTHSSRVWPGEGQPNGYQMLDNPEAIDINFKLSDCETATRSVAFSDIYAVLTKNLAYFAPVDWGY